MVTPRALPTLSIVLSLAMLAGCASTPPETASAPSDDYFARQLPGLPGGWDSKMTSPGDAIARGGMQDPQPTQVRKALLAQHERWAGTPYRLGGESERGIDCSALVQVVFLDTFRLELPRTTGDQINEGMPIDRGELQAGDLVFFRPPGAYNHVGIYVGDGVFLHASTSRGVRLSKLNNSYWRRHYWQARRPLEPTRLAQRMVLASEG